MGSILTSTKKMLGIPAAETSFDIDIITNINAALIFVNLLGVGPDPSIFITNETTDWTEFDQEVLGAVQTYVYLQVRLWFDPPQTSFTISAIENQIQALSWKLNVIGDKEVIVDE